MSDQTLIVEGTWQEVAEIGARYADRRVRLIVLPPGEIVSEEGVSSSYSLPIGTDTEPFLADEGGVLVLKSLSVRVEDWDSLVEQAREARVESLDYSGKGRI